MLKNHSIIGSQRALIRRQGSQPRGTIVKVSGTLTNPQASGTITFIRGVYIAGGDYTSIIQSLANSFGVSVSDVTITSITSGSIIIEFKINYTYAQLPSTRIIVTNVGNAIITNPSTNLSLTNNNISATFNFITPGNAPSSLVTVTDTSEIIPPPLAEVLGTLDVPSDINSFFINAFSGGGGGCGNPRGVGTEQVCGGGSGQCLVGYAGVKAGSQISFKLVRPASVPNTELPGSYGVQGAPGYEGYGLEIKYLDTLSALKTIILKGGGGGEVVGNPGVGGNSGTNPDPYSFNLYNGITGDSGYKINGILYGGVGGSSFTSGGTGNIAWGGNGPNSGGSRNGGPPDLKIQFSVKNALITGSGVIEVKNNTLLTLSAVGAGSYGVTGLGRSPNTYSYSGSSGAYVSSKSQISIKPNTNITYNLALCDPNSSAPQESTITYFDSNNTLVTICLLTYINGSGNPNSATPPTPGTCSFTPTSAQNLFNCENGILGLVDADVAKIPLTTTNYPNNTFDGYGYGGFSIRLTSENYVRKFPGGPAAMIITLS